MFKFSYKAQGGGKVFSNCKIPKYDASLCFQASISQCVCVCVIGSTNRAPKLTLEPALSTVNNNQYSTHTKTVGWQTDVHLRKVRQLNITSIFAPLYDILWCLMVGQWAAEKSTQHWDERGWLSLDLLGPDWSAHIKGPCVGLGPFH